MSRRYLEATTWLCDEIEPVVVDGRLDFPESTYEQMLVSYQIGVDWSLNALAPGYSVTDDAAIRLVGWASESLGYFDEVAHICATNIALDRPLPEPLRLFASQVLRNEVHRPKTKHRPRKRNWMETSFLYSLGTTARDQFDLNLTRNDVSDHRQSACDALSEALGICGCKKSYSEIKRLFVHSDYERFREEAARVGEAWHKKQNLKKIVEALMKKPEPQVGLLGKMRGVGLDKG